MGLIICIIIQLLFVTYICSKATADLTSVVEEATIAANSNEVTALYNVAKTWISNKAVDSSKKGSVDDGWELMKYLADEKGYVPSFAKLGHKHAEEGNQEQALQYFRAAAERGPHHASIYNVGRILADPVALGQTDWVGALAYFKMGATLHLTDPKFAQESMTKVSLEAYDILSRQAATVNLTLQECADIFLYGSLHDLPEQVESLWKEAIMALIQVTYENSEDETVVKAAVTAMKNIWEHHASLLSSLQAYLLLTHMNSMLTKLAEVDTQYSPMAAGYAEAMAMSPYCWQEPVPNSFPSCFHKAAESSILFYRQIKDDVSVDRILQMVKMHPQADVCNVT